MSDAQDRPPQWGELLALQIMAEMQPPQNHPEYLRTQSPYYATLGFTNLLHQIKIGGVVAKAKLQPDHVITGLPQKKTGSQSRPAFYIEYLSGLETVLHVDFEKTQMAMVIREHPTIDNRFQVDEINVTVENKDDVSGKMIPVTFSMDCSDRDRPVYILKPFMEAFTAAASRIAQLNLDKPSHTAADKAALTAAITAQTYTELMRRGEARQAFEEKWKKPADPS